MVRRYRTAKMKLSGLITEMVLLSTNLQKHAKSTSKWVASGRSKDAAPAYLLDRQGVLAIEESCGKHWAPSHITEIWPWRARLIVISVWIGKARPIKAERPVCAMMSVGAPLLHPVYETVLQHAYNLPIVTARDYVDAIIVDAVFLPNPAGQVGVRTCLKSMDWVRCDANLEAITILRNQASKQLLAILNEVLAVLTGIPARR